MGFFGRKKKDGTLDPHTAVQSVKPQYVSAEAFAKTAERIAEAYLNAVYSQDIRLLPPQRSEEGFYLRTRSLIEDDSAACMRTCQAVSIDSVQLSDEDIGQQFAVKSLTFDMAYTVTGTFSGPSGGNAVPYEEKRLGGFTFRNDARLSWILSGYSDFGRRDR